MLGEENPLLPLRRRFLGSLVQPDRGARRIRDLAPRPLYLQKFNRCHLLLLYHKPANGNRHKYDICIPITSTSQNLLFNRVSVFCLSGNKHQHAQVQSATIYLSYYHSRQHHNEVHEHCQMGYPRHSYHYSHT